MRHEKVEACARKNKRRGCEEIHSGCVRYSEMMQTTAARSYKYTYAICRRRRQMWCVNGVEGCAPCPCV